MEPGLVKRPLVGWVISFMAGTACGLSLPAPVWLPVGLTFAGILAICILRGRPSSRVWIHLAAAGVAWLSADLRIGDDSRDHLGRIMVRPAENLEVVGVLCDDPELGIFGPGQWIRFATMKIEKVRHVRPAITILRLSTGLPLLYILEILLQEGLNPIKYPAPDLWIGIPIVALGSFFLAVASVRARHAIWHTSGASTVSSCPQRASSSVRAQSGKPITLA